MSATAEDRSGLTADERAVLRSVRKGIFVRWCRISGLPFDEAGFGVAANRETLIAFGNLVGRHSLPSTLSLLSGNTHCPKRIVADLAARLSAPAFLKIAGELGIAAADLRADAFLPPALWKEADFSLPAAEVGAETAQTSRRRVPNKGLGARKARAMPGSSASSSAQHSPSQAAASASDSPKPVTEAATVPESRQGGNRGDVINARMSCLRALAVVFAPTEIQVRRNFSAAVAKLAETGGRIGLTQKLMEAALGGSVHIDRSILEACFALLHLGSDTIARQFLAEGVQGQADLRVFTKEFAELVLGGCSTVDAFGKVRPIGKLEPERFRVDPLPDERPHDTWAETFGRAPVIRDAPKKRAKKGRAEEPD